MFDLKEHSHTRLNLLTGDWILVSPHRMKRPWQGKTETLTKEDIFVVSSFYNFFLKLWVEKE